MSDQERKVQLGFAVNTSEARQGFDEVAKSGETMASRLAASSAKAGKAVDGIGDGGEGASRKVDAAAKSIITSIQRTTAAMEAGEKGSSAYFESLARQRGVSVDTLKPYLAQLDAAKAKQDQSVRSLGSMELSAKQTAAALRGVPAQFTDIAVSLSSGQQPLTVLLQQGGQLKDMFGGVGNAARALGGYVLGLVNPYTVVAAAVAGLAVAYEKGRAEEAAFSNGLILSGNAVGASAGQLMDMAASVDAANSSITQGRAAEVLGQIAAKGGVAVASLERFTRVAVEFEQAGGGAAQDVAKAFSDLAKDPLAATLKLNEGMNFLTESVYNQIKSLQEQGKVLEAAAVAQNAYATALESRTPKLLENLGLLERSWKTIKGVAAEAWDAMLNVGRSSTIGEQIADAEKRLGELKDGRATAFGYGAAERARDVAAQQAVVDALREQDRLLKSAADQERQRGQQVKARVEFDKAGESFLDKQAKKAREIAAARELGLRAGASEEEIRKRVLAIEEKYAEKVSKTRGAQGKGDAFAADRAAAQSWAAAFKDFADLASTAEAKTVGLSEAQRKLQEYLQSPAYANASEPMRQLVLEQAYAAIGAEQTAEALKREQEALQALTAAEEERLRAQQRSTAGVEGQLQKLLDEEQALAIAAASNISLAQAIEEVTIARLREAQARELSFGNEGLAAEIQREIDAREKLKEAIGRKDQREVVKKQAEDAQKEWQKTADQIGDALTKALMRGFEDGKSFGENFSDSLVNAFKTYVARELQQSLARAISGAFGGQGGFNLGSLFGGGGQGGLNWGDLASKAWGWFSGGGSAASGAIANGMTQAQMIAIQDAAVGVTTNVATGAVTAATTTGATTAASTGASAAGAGALGAVPVVGWIAAAVMAADALYKKGYNREALNGVGESKDYKYSAENAARGLLDGLGFSKKWADILSGTVRMATLFGRRLKQEGYEVDIAGQDVDVERYAFYKGGLLRSNKTVRGEADPEAVESLRFQVENVRDSSKAMAQALGYSGDALDDFTGRMRVNLKGADDSAEAAKRYEDALLELQRQMINSVTGLNYTKEQFKKFTEDVTASMTEAGISASGIADIITQGMLGKMSQAQVGEALSDMVIGGVYNAIASNYAGQIASVFTGQIIQPIFTAIAAGVPISQAISQQAISSVVNTAQQAAATLNAIFADPNFRAAISGVQQAIAGISGAATSVRAPAYKSATASYNAAADAAKRAAEETRRAWQSIADSITEEIRRIKGEVVGDTSMGQSYYLAQFEEATRRARAGDQQAASMLPELSQAVLDIARATSGSLAELQYLQTSTIASLTQTRKVLSQRFGLTIPAFAEGGMHSGGVRLVGERGAELEVTGPARYYSAEQTQKLLGSDPELRREIQSLAAAMNRLADSNGQIETHTRQTRAILDRVSQGGDAILMVNA